MHHHHHPLLLLLLIPITFTNTLIPSVDAAVVSGTGTWRVKSGETGSLCIHSLLLPDNKLVCVERPHQSPVIQILNEKTGGWTSSLVDLSRDQITFTSLKDLTTNPFCAGHAQAADGSIWVIGGDKQNSSNPDIGFDLKDALREGEAGSRRARWYPTVVTMHDEKLTGENSQILELFVWAYPHVLYPVSFQKTVQGCRVMVCGGVQKGGGLSSNQCYSIEADTPGAKWTREPDMPRGRVMPDSVLLPDGTILFTNGARWGVAGGNAGQAQYCAGPWFDTDIYNPVTRTWSTIGRSVVPRLYHSGAILLQDGSVITTGSEMQNYQDLWGDPECYPNKYENGTEAMACAWPYEMRIEFFSHPYLTASTRPEILSSPLTATYNSTILVTLSPTLLFNNGTHAVFRVPPHGGVAPPGNYHLFVVTGDGVPSVGRRLMIRADHGEIGADVTAEKIFAVTACVVVAVAAMLW
ncbi:hypothetical protein BC829DRAFT_388580 [Chytridium lagenaria]|nr:hypothetical protein BC829DRAFT_388580 [Chytridium lagenaria]